MSLIGGVGGGGGVGDSAVGPLRFLNRLEVFTMNNLDGPQENVVDRYCLEHGIPVHRPLMPANLNHKQKQRVLSSWLPTWPAAEFDVAVAMSFGYLIPPFHIPLFPLGGLNVHTSLLPRYRGPAPIQRAIANGEQEIGATVITLDPRRFDAGLMLAQRSVPLDPDHRYQQVRHTVCEVGVDLLMRVLQAIAEDGWQEPDKFYKKHGRPQPKFQVTLAPKFAKKERRVRWARDDCRQIYNQWRALSETVDLFTFFLVRDLELHLKELRPADDAVVAAETSSMSLSAAAASPSCRLTEPGQFRLISESELLICCAQHTFLICSRLQYPSKKPLSPAEFLNGHRLKKNRVYKFR